MKKLIYILTVVLTFTACSKEVETTSPQVVNLDESQQEDAPELSLDYLNDYLFEKLDGQSLARNYGEDTGWTSMNFTADGTFSGSYMGKIHNDGFDGGLTETAQVWYHAEEIHSSDFKGKFTITEQVNDYVYKMKLDEFEITSEVGPHDDIYYNVDFALGIKPDADYYLYIPGTPATFMPGEDNRLDNNYKDENAKEDKSQGFIIWNKYEDEVFNQLKL